VITAVPVGSSSDGAGEIAAVPVASSLDEAGGWVDEPPGQPAEAKPPGGVDEPLSAGDAETGSSATGVGAGAV
jgi:hypothetical protein